MPDSPETKRWKRFEARYGDEFRKLNKTDQRQIRELIRNNDGEQARKLTAELDDTRRMKERIRSKLRRVLKRKDAGQVITTNPFKGINTDESTFLKLLYEGKSA